MFQNPNKQEINGTQSVCTYPKGWRGGRGGGGLRRRMVAYTHSPTHSYVGSSHNMDAPRA